MSRWPWGSAVSDTITELKSRKEESETVTLSISSGFASQWLLPRLERFQHAFPSVNLRLQVMASRLYGPLDGADLGIRLHKLVRSTMRSVSVRS